MIRGSLLALTALAVGAATAQDDELSLQRSRWEQAATSRYQYVYQKFCECQREQPPQTVVVVENGAVTRVYHLHADSEREVPAREGSLDLYWTMDDLFGLIGNADSIASMLRVQYHEALGYPTQLFIDYDSSLVGEELDLRLIRVELLD